MQENVVLMISGSFLKFWEEAQLVSGPLYVVSVKLQADLLLVHKFLGIYIY